MKDHTLYYKINTGNNVIISKALNEKELDLIL
jgi:hypothetical protein